MANVSKSPQEVPTVFQTSEKGVDGPWRLIEVKKESYSKKDGDTEFPGSLITLVLQRCKMPAEKDIVALLNGEEQKPGNPPRYTKGVNLPVIEYPVFRYDASATIKTPFYYMKLIKPYQCEVPGSEFVRFWNAAGWNRKIGAGFKVLKTVGGELPMLNGKIDDSAVAGEGDSLIYLNLKLIPNGKYRAKNVITGFSCTPPDEDLSDVDLESEAAQQQENEESEEIDATQPAAEGGEATAEQPAATEEKPAASASEVTTPEVEQSADDKAAKKRATAKQSKEA